MCYDWYGYQCVMMITYVKACAGNEPGFLLG